MFAGPLLRLRLVAQGAAHKALWGAMGGLLSLLGAGFVFAALFIVVASAFGTAAACLIFGGLFLGLGFVAFAWAQRPPRVVPKEAARQMSSIGGATRARPGGLTTAGLINALVLGISAGRAARRKR